MDERHAAMWRIANGPEEVLEPYASRQAGPLLPVNLLQ